MNNRSLFKIVFISRTPSNPRRIGAREPVAVQVVAWAYDVEDAVRIVHANSSDKVPVDSIQEVVNMQIPEYLLIGDPGSPTTLDNMVQAPDDEEEAPAFTPTLIHP